MKTAFIFPGQGSQKIGMGKDIYDAFPEAREVYQEVDDALNQKLSNIIFNGNEAELTLTENAQPAIMATSIAILRVLEKEIKFDIATACEFMAGHSLGEYSALCASRVFSLADTAKLLKIRGMAMQEAVPAGKGAMAAIIGLEIDQVEEIVKDVNGVCDVANHNSPAQIVISGENEAVEKAMEKAKEKGAKRALKLAVSAPFHSSLMKPAAEKMAEALANVNMEIPMVPVVANVSAKPTVDIEEIRDLLVLQVTGRVRWFDTMAFFKEQEIEQTVEIGFGKVLTGLTRQNQRDISGICIQSVEDIESFIPA